jgi:hypothetical protein
VYRYHRLFLIRAECQLQKLAGSGSLQGGDLGYMVGHVALYQLDFSLMKEIELTSANTPLTTEAASTGSVGLSLAHFSGSDKCTHARQEAITKHSIHLISGNALSISSLTQLYLGSLRFSKTPSDTYCREHYWSKEHKQGFNHTWFNDYPRWKDNSR